MVLWLLPLVQGKALNTLGVGWWRRPSLRSSTDIFLYELQHRIRRVVLMWGQSPFGVLISAPLPTSVGNSAAE